MKEKLNKILNTGCDQIELESQMYLRQVNINGLFFFFVCLGLAAIFYFLVGDFKLTQIMILTAIGFLVCSIGFNYAGFTTLSRMSTVCVVSISITGCAFYIGQDAYFTAYLILGAIYPFTYFSIENKKEILICLMILFCCYLLITILDYKLGPRIAYIAPESIALLKVLAFLISFAGIIYNSFIAIYDRDRKNKEVLRSQKLLETIFFTLAHDLAAPLQSISIISQQAEARGSLPPDRIKKLNLSSQQMVRNFNNLKVVAQTSINGWRYELNNSHLTVLELVIDAVELLQDQAAIKGVKIIVDIHGPIANARVNVDRDLFVFQVLNNVLSNAIKFSNSGQKVNISAGYGKDGDVQIHIQDWGTGIDNAAIGKLFDLSIRNSKQGTNGERGTGLGLPLANKFLVFMQGRFEITSKFHLDSTTLTGESGTTVTINLPNYETIQSIKAS